MGFLQPGDLLFWGARGRTSHVAIYIGNGEYIHAPQPGQNVKVGKVSYTGFTPSFARRILADEPVEKPSTEGQQANERYIFRLYNPNEGNHHYTQNLIEATNLQNIGWIYEGVGWVSPDKGTPIYQLYNPNNGRHHYTSNSGERDNLVQVGWRSEGVAWQSGGSIPVYRVYNPKAQGREDSHVYTTNTNERDNLIRLGWRSEGVAWYAVRNHK